MPALIACVVAVALAGSSGGSAHAAGEGGEPGTGTGGAQGIGTMKPQSLNGVLLPASPPRRIRLFVVGHMYGSALLDDADPARTLTSRINAVSALQPTMLVSLGDMVRGTDVDQLATVRRQVFDPIGAPAYNAPGNHDVGDRALYEQLYGRTFGAFGYGRSVFVFLDSERGGCSLGGRQRRMVGRAFGVARRQRRYANIFVFMHRTAFFHGGALAATASPLGRPNDMRCLDSHGYADLRRMASRLARHKPVYVFAGDVGVRANLSPYIQRWPHSKLTLMMTGLGDQPTDSAIVVDIRGTKVSPRMIGLGPRSRGPLGRFTRSYWLRRARDGAPY